MDNYWNSLEYWELLEAPLRVDNCVVEKFKELIDETDSVLLLGCTKELYTVTKDVTVIDINQQRINMFKPIGKVVCGDWLNIIDELDFNIQYVIGDGSFNCLRFQEWPCLIHSVKKVLNPGGKIIVRIFETPANVDSLKNIKEKIENKEIATFSELKWILAMYLAYTNNHVVVEYIRDLFYLIFDKEKLSKQTGWSLESINTIDAYENSKQIYCFPSERQIKKEFPESKRIQVLGYPMAERCPFYVFE